MSLKNEKIKFIVNTQGGDTHTKDGPTSRAYRKRKFEIKTGGKRGF